MSQVRDVAPGAPDEQWLRLLDAGVVLTSDKNITRRTAEVAAYKSAGHMVVLVDQALLRQAEQHRAAGLLCLAWGEIQSTFRTEGAKQAFKLRNYNRRNNWLVRA